MDAEKRLAQTIKADLRFNKIKIGDYLINYVTAGSGKPLLLIHGGNIGWGQWYPNLAELSKYFKVYAIDLPGAGRSTPVEYNMFKLDRYLDIVDTFIKLMNLRNVNIVGHSLGGWIALKLILRENKYIDKIVLVNSIGFSDHIPFTQRILSIYLLAKLLTKTVMRPTKTNMKRFLAGVFHNPAVLDEKFIDYFYENVNKSKLSHPLLFISSISRLYRMDKELVLLDNLAKVRRPTLIIVGDKDPLTPLTNTSRAFGLIPGARLEIFLNAGHVPSLEQSERFNELVIRFLGE